jgi:drug/metabolite transporter (DMT)-like permease
MPAGYLQGAPVAAVLAAVSAAAVTAMGTAMQQRATQAVPEGRGLHLSLVGKLVRTPIWLAGVGATAVGFGLFLLSLAKGALVLAQPIMVSGVVFGPLFAAWFARRRVDRGLLAGGALCWGGLLLFLAVARPSGGAGSPAGPAAAGWLALALGGLLVAAIVTAVRSDGLSRALALATATAVLFGINAALAKLVADQLARGWSEPFSHPQCYAMLLTAPTGFVLSQRAMQLGRVLAPVTAVISSVDPVVAVAIGVVALGERMDHSPPALVGEIMAVAVALAGVRAVSVRAARLIEADRSARESGRRAPTWG